ncbi:MAG: response regulator transcription factor [Phycisphaerales bacterium]|nr:MAG: response regulator transcription factor [Phycisphaerales bacterium]
MEVATEAKVFSGGEWLRLRDDLALPPRQAAVVEQLFLGHSDKQIAYELNMSVATVRTHMRRLFSRFHVEDRCGLVVEVFTYFRRQYQPC